MIRMNFHFCLKKTSKPKHTRIKLDFEKWKNTAIAVAFQATIGGLFAPLVILEEEDRVT